MTSKKNQKAKVNPDLAGFDVGVDTFGEITTSYNIDELNDFLNKNVEDKKLKDRDDLEKSAPKLKD
jgi:hypothetical protein